MSVADTGLTRDIADYVVRPASSDDLGLVHQTLYLALSWNPDDVLPPIEVVVEHPKIAIYHQEWMRRGDDGFVAESEDGQFLGMAFCRVFPEGSEAGGFVDVDTPELAVAVVEEARGLGVGRRLIEELHRSQSAAGTLQMSLSVNADNPATRLYERLGYREVRSEGDSIVMVAPLTVG